MNAWVNINRIHCIKWVWQHSKGVSIEPLAYGPDMYRMNAFPTMKYPTLKRGQGEGRYASAYLDGRGLWIIQLPHSAYRIFQGSFNLRSEVRVSFWGYLVDVGEHPLTVSQQLQALYPHVKHLHLRRQLEACLQIINLIQILAQDLHWNTGTGVTRKKLKSGNKFKRQRILIL